jgi:hypothetical protein
MAVFQYTLAHSLSDYNRSLLLPCIRKKSSQKLSRERVTVLAMYVYVYNTVLGIQQSWAYSVCLLYCALNSYLGSVTGLVWALTITQYWEQIIEFDDVTRVLLQSTWPLSSSWQFRLRSCHLKTKTNNISQNLCQVTDRHRKTGVNVLRSDSFTMTSFILGSVPRQGKQIFLSLLKWPAHPRYPIGAPGVWGSKNF